MIPQTFEQWKHCLEEECKIELSAEFIRKRLAIYEDKQNSETEKFVSLYGDQHLLNVIQWFHQLKI